MRAITILRQALVALNGKHARLSKALQLIGLWALLQEERPERILSVIQSQYAPKVRTDCKLKFERLSGELQSVSSGTAVVLDHIRECVRRQVTEGVIL